MSAAHPICITGILMKDNLSNQFYARDHCEAVQNRHMHMRPKHAVDCGSPNCCFQRIGEAGNAQDEDSA